MKHIKPIKGVWPVLLICLLLSAVLCGVCGVLRLVVLRADTYMRAVEIPSVRREMYQAIREDLELQCRQYAMSWENVSGGDLRRGVKRMYQSVFFQLCYGVSFRRRGDICNGNICPQR